VGAELFYADRHDEVNSCFSQFCEMQELEILNYFITDKLIISVGDKTSQYDKKNTDRFTRTG